MKSSKGSNPILEGARHAPLPLPSWFHRAPPNRRLAFSRQRGCLQPCHPRSQAPLYAPIALTQVGSAAEFEFWAYPKDSHEKNVLAVGLRIKRNWDGLDDDATHAQYLKMLDAKIRLKLTTTLDESPTPLRSYSEFDPTLQIRPLPGVGSAEVRVHSWGHDGDYQYYYIADLSRQEGGKYKVKVQVEQPNEDVKGMQAEVFVAFRLFGGK